MPSTQPLQWLRHSDARQVSDLPLSAPLRSTVYDRGGSETLERKIRSRQVEDLPRIRVAEPLLRFIDDSCSLGESSISMPLQGRGRRSSRSDEMNLARSFKAGIEEARPITSRQRRLRMLQPSLTRRGLIGGGAIPGLKKAGLNSGRRYAAKTKNCPGSLANNQDVRLNKP